MNNYEIEIYDSPDRFRVKKSEDCHYLVELFPEQCSCDDFHFRKRRCKHIRAVIDWLASRSNP